MSQDRKTTGSARSRRLRNLFVGVVALGLTGTAAHGQDFEQNLIAQLQLQGYAQIQVERTFLGRVRILALQNGVMREIVLNPRTGEVLRDVWLAGADGNAPVLRAQPGSGNSASSGGAGAGTGASGGNSGGGSGSGGSNDDGPDDDEDSDDSDDDDDDNDDGDSDSGED
jgi:uncharacterized membrane protein YgcG